jgi:hypothetical protein
LRCVIQRKPEMYVFQAPILCVLCMLTNTLCRNFNLSSRLSNLYNLSTFAQPSSDVSTKRRRMEYLGGTQY